MEKFTVASGVNITCMPNEKFKRNRISINFILPNTKENATKYALLPGLLERAYRDYPDMRQFSRKLARMYSAQATVAGFVVGANRVVRFSVQGIKNEYCINGEDLLAQMSDVLLGLIFRPCVQDGAFNAEWLEIEKFKLKEEIQGEINEKRSYCVKSARRKFFGDSVNGVERLGYIEEIDGITPRQLYDCYQNLLRTARVEIFITAGNGQEKAKEKLIQAFSHERENVASILPVQLQPATREPQIYSETVDAVQGKVCLVYTTKRLLTEEERYYMLIAGALYGGTANSRLFKNVREKKSLCYYCAAAFNGFTSSMTVDSGVEHHNIDVTVDAVREELSRLINGDITDDEIQQTKLVIKNSLQSNYDAVHGLEAWYLNEAMRGSDLSPEQVMDKVDAVTAQNIKDVLSLLNLNVVYSLRK